MEQLAKRLEALNPHITPETIKQSKMGGGFDVCDWLGQSATDYLNKKNQAQNQTEDQRDI